MIKHALVNKRIFTIEDDVDQILAITNTLAYYGASFCYEAWDATNIVASIIRRLPLDLILLDLMFPKGVTGYDIFAEFCAHPLLHGIPVVAVSALDPAVEIPKAKQMGFAGFIAKPINLEVFADQLRQSLTGQTVWIS